MKTFVIEEGKWRLSPDEECYVLQKSRKVKGKLKWEAEGYYSTLGDVLAACLRAKIRDSEEELPLALEEAVKVVSTASDRLRQDLSVTVEIPLKEGQDAETVRLML